MVLMTEAMCARPMREADRYSCLARNAGLACASSLTVTDWVTATSSSTPRAPMRIPASSSPRMLTLWKLVLRKLSSSLAMPVSWVTLVAKAANTPVSTRLARVPRTATEVGRVNPWVRYSTVNMIAAEPTMATSSGGRPARIAGTMNSSSTANVTANPARAVSPTHRPNAITAIANPMTSIHSWKPRCWSRIW